jgi:hypothetical protein
VANAPSGDADRRGGGFRLVKIHSTVVMIRKCIGTEAVAFGVLRGLTLVGGMAALFIVPLRPEHQLHLVPLLAEFIVYNVAVPISGGGPPDFRAWRRSHTADDRPDKRAQQ